MAKVAKTAKRVGAVVATAAVVTGAAFAVQKARKTKRFR
jgi:hypothetical protein